ncbi:hypothetical protein IW147_005558 [Coemansia sp. RSA 720]|nr:hypothetical protein IW147_005558 [Coemansia sp. RSA 720]KAJ2540635.1 hypothetical protein GGF49_004298 [Coemansia sp. RSA 1853]
MPPRKSRRSAAVAAQSAMVEDSSELDELLASPKPRGRSKKPAAKTAKGQQATPTRAKQTEVPPDTAGIVKRTRPAAKAATAKEAAPKSRGSKGPARKTQPKKHAESAESESEHDDKMSDHNSIGLEELSISDDAMPETPTRRRGGAASSLAAKKHSVEEVEAQSPAAGRRGRKRKSDSSQSAQPEASTSVPPAKRGRPRKVQEESEDKAPPTPPTLRKQPAKTKSDETPPQSPVRRGRPQKIPAQLSPQLPVSTRRTAQQRDKPTHDVYVDIVSPSKFESNRSKIRSARLHSTGTGRNAATDETDNWRAKYEELLAKRQSQPEEEYREFREKAQERFDSADVVINNLRKEVASLKRKATPKKPDAEAQANTEANMRKAIEKEFEKQLVLLRQQVEKLTQDMLTKDESIARLEKHRKMTETTTDYNLRRKLHVMEEVSGLTIDDLVPEDDGISYICRQAGPATSARYVLTAFEDLPNEYQYTPVGDTAALPTYLHEPISFERAAASMFYWRVCSHLRQPAPAEDSAATPQPATANGT